MTQRKQHSAITPNGYNQGDVVAFLSNAADLVNQLRQLQLYQPLGNPAFAISSNFDVLNNSACDYSNNGTTKTLAQYTNFDTGTTKTITGSKWSSALLSVNSSGSTVLTWASSSYDTEALAIAALPTAASTDTVLGYVTVNAHASGYIAGTSALTGGTGGNVATATNYYNNLNPNATLLGSAVSLLPN